MCLCWQILDSSLMQPLASDRLADTVGTPLPTCIYTPWVNGPTYSCPKSQPLHDLWWFTKQWVLSEQRKSHARAASQFKFANAHKSGGSQNSEFCQKTEKAFSWMLSGTFWFKVSCSTSRRSQTRQTGENVVVVVKKMVRKTSVLNRCARQCAFLRLKRLFEVIL